MSITWITMEEGLISMEFCRVAFKWNKWKRGEVKTVTKVGGIFRLVHTSLVSSTQHQFILLLYTIELSRATQRSETAAMDALRETQLITGFKELILGTKSVSPLIDSF
jgi:hypothetical protein